MASTDGTSSVNATSDTETGGGGEASMGAVPAAVDADAIDVFSDDEDEDGVSTPVAHDCRLLFPMGVWHWILQTILVQCLFANTTLHTHS